MKKLIATILCLATVLGLCACAGGGEDTPAGLQVGYAREKIHPKESVPLAGYGQTSNRMSEGSLDYLYATCVAFKEGDNTVLMISQDIISSRPKLVEQIREQITEQTGIPGENVMICATHTHSAPDLSSSLPSIASYTELYVEGVVKAAVEAVADLAPGTLSAASTDAEMNFIRHYKMNDGSYAGSNFGDWSSGIADHVRDNDPEMQLVKIDREGDKKDILMINWQAHPCNTGGETKTDISADYIAPLRDKIEVDTGMQVIYFLGASGDQNAKSLMDDDLGLKHQEYGEKLAQYAQDALPNLQPVEGSGIQKVQVIYEGTVNHEDEHLQVEAQQVVEMYNTKGKDLATELAHTLGISSVYHANAILARPKRPAINTLEINAIRVGGMAFITAPYEMFRDHGVFIKENSPFDITFICSCSNDAKSYIPTADAYDYGCYESYISIFAKGVGESLADKYVELLKGLQ